MFTDYELDWSRVPEWANWVAQDADGEVFAFEREPIRGENVWRHKPGDRPCVYIANAHPNPNWWTACALRPVAQYDTANPGLVPFKDLPESTQLTYMRAFLDGNLQALAGRTHDDEWFECMSLRPVAIVRIAPPSTKPLIDWSHVASEYRYLTRDADGCAYLWNRKPHIRSADSDWWFALGGCKFASADVLASYTPGSCDWKDSLVERPEGQ
jgi:hypothetical protein